MKPVVPLAIAVFVFSGCHKESTSGQPKPPAPVRVEVVSTITPDSSRRYSASIMPFRQVTLAFRSGGFVEWIREMNGADGRERALGPGDPVEKGEVLARVRVRDYDLKVDQAQGQLAEARQAESATRAQLLQAQAAATKATLDFERASRLFASQSITKPDYDSARAQRDATQAQVASAQAQIDVAAARIRSGQAGTDEAMLARSDSDLAASFKGYVVQRQVELGALVSAGTAAFTVADLDSVKAMFGLPDLEVQTLKLGSKLTLIADALPGRDFQGVVTAVSPVADASTHLFPVEVTIRNPQTMLLAGMIVSARPGGRPTEPVLVAPLSAIVKGQSSQFAVMAIEGAGETAKATRKEVVLGETFGNRIQITQGLREGDRIVVSGAALLNDGDAVRIIP